MVGIVAENKARVLPCDDVSGEISVSLCVFGVGIRLNGSPAYDINPVIREYSAFQRDELRASWTITWDGHASPTRLTVNGNVYLGVPRESVCPIISMKIMDRVYEATEDLYLFHGAAAAWQGVLFIFPGESGTGKSSLSVSLATRGWTLLSDEVIAISRKNLQAVPFPRAIAVWRTAPVFHELPRVRGHRWELAPIAGKRIKAMIPFPSFSRVPSALAPGAIVCLRGGRREVRKGGGQIVVTYWDERIERLARKRGIDGNLHVRRVGEFWCIKSDRVEMVEDTCTSLGGIVVERDPLEDIPPAFGETPLLEPISPSECLIALWSVFENGRALTHCEGEAAGLYLKLAQLVRGVPCFWLRPGPPSPTCELLQDLAEKLGKARAARE